ncbi:MAG: CoA-binding protein [Thermodesulfobacteriota bacterium]|nr:CoA-binding protein [Thermodesulfobacteriota bacterium]
MSLIQTNLETMFNPNTVAVIGASDNPDKLGFHVMKSLNKGGFAGKIIPLNPTSPKIWGLPAYRSIKDYTDRIQLAIVVVPAKLVPGVFAQCAEKDVKGIVLITAGFKEIDDPQGAKLHQKIAAIVNPAKIPVIGPNTFGMIDFHANLNASFTPEFSLLKKGKIALVSQSGGISHLLGFLAMRVDVRFSKIIGLGNRLNVDFAEIIDYLMNDSATNVIMLYMEGIDDPTRFIEAVKKYRHKKPVIIYKTGSSEKGDQAVKSHTGSMAGKHEIYQGAFSQAGILSLDSAESLLDTAKAFGSSGIPQGPGVAVLSGQAGPGLAACDACEACGLKIARFEKLTQQSINKFLPPLALRTNPVDMGPAWYNASAQSGIIRAVINDKNVNAILLLIMFASANANLLEEMSEFLTEFKQAKPIISCILAPPGVWDDNIRHLEESGALVNYPTPEQAARAMANLVKYRSMQFDIKPDTKG